MFTLIHEQRTEGEHARIHALLKCPGRVPDPPTVCSTLRLPQLFELLNDAAFFGWARALYKTRDLLTSVLDFKFTADQRKVLSKSSNRERLSGFIYCCNLESLFASVAPLKAVVVEWNQTVAPYQPKAPENTATDKAIIAYFKTRLQHQYVYTVRAEAFGSVTGAAAAPLALVPLPGPMDARGLCTQLALAMRDAALIPSDGPPTEWMPVMSRGHLST